jgi:hypothetical protein
MPFVSGKNLDKLIFQIPNFTGLHLNIAALNPGTVQSAAFPAPPYM